MKYSLVLEIPEDSLINELPADVQYELQVLETLYPSEPAVGTIPDLGKKLLYCIITTEIKKLETFLNSLIIIYELDWKIACLQSWLAPAPIIEAVGDEETVIGHKALVLVPFNSAIILPYLAPRYIYDKEGNQTGEQTKQMNWMSHYQGAADWRDEI